MRRTFCQYTHTYRRCVLLKCQRFTINVHIFPLTLDEIPCIIKWKKQEEMQNCARRHNVHVQKTP
jgi:hypothetical protein